LPGDFQFCLIRDYSRAAIVMNHTELKITLTHPPDLGSAATAGIVCDIIFSVVLFNGEIIFLKFFYNGDSFGRSVTY
jgi:hypothetical protein